MEPQPSRPPPRRSTRGPSRSTRTRPASGAGASAPATASWSRCPSRASRRRPASSRRSTWSGATSPRPRATRRPRPATTPPRRGTSRASRSTRTASGHWRWRLRAGNGELLAIPEQGFASKAGVIKALDVVRRNVADAEGHVEPDADEQHPRGGAEALAHQEGRLSDGAQEGGLKLEERPRLRRPATRRQGRRRPARHGRVDHRPPARHDLQGRRGRGPGPRLHDLRQDRREGALRARDPRQEARPDHPGGDRAGRPSRSRPRPRTGPVPTAATTGGHGPVRTASKEHP